jgi:hypothetical protein
MSIPEKEENSRSTLQEIRLFPKERKSQSASVPKVAMFSISRELLSNDWLPKGVSQKIILPG